MKFLNLAPRIVISVVKFASFDRVTYLYYGVSNHGFDGILFLNDQLRYCNDLVSWRHNCPERCGFSRSSRNRDKRTHPRIARYLMDKEHIYHFSIIV